MEKKIGLLLVNTGSPDSCSIADVREYLREFLMDPRVLDMPWPLRAAIVYGGILPFRPARSAAAYGEIWTSAGSPLVATTHRLAERLRLLTDMPVAVAMRYGSLSPAKAVEQLLRDRMDELAVLPMFPHYALSSYESAIEHVKAAVRKCAPDLRLRAVPPCYEQPAYIRALTASARPYVSSDVEHVLFSYHGMPVRHLRKVSHGCGNCASAPHDEWSAAHCYLYQTTRTSDECARSLGLDAGRYSIAYQSRLGHDRWIEPSTSSELSRLARSGIRRLVVICPSFTVDCLETLEEIATRGKETFLSNGGEEFCMVPALNDNETWATALVDIIASTLPLMCN